MSMLFTAILTFAAVAVSGALPPPGAHLVEHTTIYLMKFNKTSPVELYYPHDYVNSSVPFPVVVMSHGKGEGQSDTEPVPVPYFELFEEIVSTGAIVVALQTCLAPGCRQAFADQLSAVDMCKRLGEDLHPVFHKADFKSVALLGHGLGGQHTEWSARKIGFSIKAAVAMHSTPHVQWARQAIVPTLYITGTEDEVAPATAVKEAFAANTQLGTRIANLAGAGHDEPTHFAEGRMNRYVALYVRCHAARDDAACKHVADMCFAYTFEDCAAKAYKRPTEAVDSRGRAGKTCLPCMAYFFVLLFFLFVCLLITTSNWTCSSLSSDCIRAQAELLSVRVDCCPPQCATPWFS